MYKSFRNLFVICILVTVWCYLSKKVLDKMLSTKETSDVEYIDIEVDFTNNDIDSDCE